MTNLTCWSPIERVVLQTGTLRQFSWVFVSWSECRCVVEPWNLTDTLQIKRGCPYSSFQPTRGLGLVTNSSIPTSSRYTWTFDLHVGTWFMQLCSCLIPFFVNCVPPFALFNAKKTNKTHSRHSRIAVIVVTSEATCGPGDPFNNERLSSKHSPLVEAHTC